MTSATIDLKACDRLATDNIKLVYFVCKKYLNLSYYEDLIQEGTIELIKAARKFDSSLGFKFSSYAVPYIRGGVLHYIRDKSGTIRNGSRDGTSIPVMSLDRTLKHLDTPTTLGECIPAAITEPDSDLELIQEFTAQLPQRSQLLFEMKLNGATNKAIAHELDISPMTVTRRLDRLIQMACEWVDGTRRDPISVAIKPAQESYRPFKFVPIIEQSCSTPTVVETFSPPSEESQTQSCWECELPGTETTQVPIASDDEWMFEEIATPKLSLPEDRPITRPVARSNTGNWTHLRIDIQITFDIYLKAPSWRSIDRCINALYKFGQLAIKRKYWHLNGSDGLDNLVSWEDLLHESICKLRQSLIDRKLQSYEHAIAMLYIFAKYSYWGMLKQSAKYTSLNKAVSSEIDTNLEDFVASTIAAITPERSEDLEIIETALSKLPSLNKQVIELAWIEDKTVTQISQQMQVTIPFVSNIIQKSRIAIARSLTGRKMSLGY